MTTHLSYDECTRATWNAYERAVRDLLADGLTLDGLHRVVAELKHGSWRPQPTAPLAPDLVLRRAGLLHDLATACARAYGDGPWPFPGDLLLDAPDDAAALDG